METYWSQMLMLEGQQGTGQHRNQDQHQDLQEPSQEQLLDREWQLLVTPLTMITYE